MVETKRHGDAFDYYYSLGGKRSYAQVGRKLGVSKTSVEKWGREFNWKLRVTQRDLEINRKTEKKTNKAIVNTKADYRAEIATDRKELKIFRQRSEKLIAEVADAIQDGSIKIESIADLDRVVSSLKKYHDLNKDYINLDLDIIGEKGEITGDFIIISAVPRPEKSKDGD